VNGEPVDGVLDQPSGLDSTGRQASAMYRQPPRTTVFQAEHAHRASILSLHGTLQLLLTGRLQCTNGLRIFCGLGRWTLSLALTRV
jgi:hypothetical protein